MKRKYLSENDAISVYEFMENCGLICNRKKGIKISHKIMLKKLALRKKLFPEKVVCPTEYFYRTTDVEGVYTGKLCYVVDDYGNKMFYRNPMRRNILSLLEELNSDENKSNLSKNRNIALKSEGYYENKHGEVLPKYVPPVVPIEEQYHIDKFNRQNQYVITGKTRLLRKK